MLEFRTLGTIDLREGSRLLEAPLRHSKRVALLAYLAVPNPVRSHRRETLVALLWPDLDSQHGRGMLRHELYALRQILGPEAFQGDGGEAIGVNGERLWCDARAFETAVESGHLTQAMDLVRGELLPGLHVDGGEFGHWLDGARARLTQRACLVADRISARAEKNGDFSAAILWVRRWTELAWHDETAWRRLLSLLDRTGDRAGALSSYDSFAARLRETFEVEPAPETRALVERIRARSAVRPDGDRVVSDENGGGMVATDLNGATRALDQHSVPIVVVIRPTENLTGDSRHEILGKRITDRLSGGISELAYVEVVVGARIPWATAIVSAHLENAEAGLEARTRLTEAGEGGRLLAVHEPVALADDPSEEILDEVVARMMASVAAHYDPRVPIAFVGGSPVRTPSWKAWLEFIQGAEAFGAYRFDEAAQRLRRANEIDPDFTKAGIFAAIALAYCGDPAGAEALATESLRIGAETASEYERHFGAYLLADLRGDRSGAYRATQETIRLTSHPVLLFLAGREAFRLLRPREALPLLERSDHGQGWWRNWVEIFEVQGAAYHLLGEHHSELEVVLSGRTRFPEALEPMRAEVRARAALGEAKAVLETVDEAMSLLPRLISPADVAWTAAQELEVHGHGEAASEARHLGLAWLASHEGGTAECSLEIRLLIESGDLEGAGSRLAELAPLADLEPLGLAGLLSAMMGDEASAVAVIGQLRALENPYLSGRHLLLEAEIQAMLGRSDMAIDALRRARADGLTAVVELHAMPTLRPLRSEPEFIAFLRPRG